MATLPEKTIAELAQRLVDLGFSAMHQFQLDKWCDDNMGDLVQIYIDDPDTYGFRVKDAIGALAKCNTPTQAAYAFVRLSSAVDEAKINAKVYLVNTIGNIEYEREYGARP